MRMTQEQVTVYYSAYYTFYVLAREILRETLLTVVLYRWSSVAAPSFTHTSFSKVSHFEGERAQGQSSKYCARILLTVVVTQNLWFSPEIYYCITE